MSGGAAGDGKKGAPRIDLVPILDAMTSVIFFLILSSTFIELTKVTIPPSTTSTLPAQDKKNPLVPTLTASVAEGQNIKIILSWGGDHPDQITKEVKRVEPKKRSKDLEAATKDLVENFVKKFPQEKTLQLGLSKLGSYQELITLMDGVRANIQDIVLIEPQE